jgi:hypothetical protein
MILPNLEKMQNRFSIGSKRLSGSYEILDRILCDGHVIEHGKRKDKSLNINTILCDGYVIERNKQRYKPLNTNGILCDGLKILFDGYLTEVLQLVDLQLNNINVQNKFVIGSKILCNSHVINSYV